MTQSEVALDTAEYTDWLDVTWDDAGGRSQTLRRVWKAGTAGANESGLRAAVTAEIDALVAEARALTTEATRLRDPAVTFTTMQLRTNLARLADDTARLGLDVARLAQLAVRKFDQPGPLP
ncbi:MAG: hypothetical protein M3540_01010 [Actinomycetota bacterium]|nr:hypothetical protein [Actinomycetota bacterium]